MHYTMGPFAFESEIAFPELTWLDEPDLVRVNILRATQLPNGIAGGHVLDEYCVLTEREFLLHVPGVARFYVLGGREVRFVPEPEAAERDIRIFLLGSVFGVLCYQNGFLPLHASAVASEDGVTAFLADSGMGKSTLAAFLGRRGFPVVADDICLLRPTPAGTLSVVPVGGWLKLWKASLDALGEEPLEQHRVLSQEEKYRVYHQAETLRAGRGCLRLARIVFLQRPAPELPAQELEWTPLSPPVALGALMDATYHGELLLRLGLERRLFGQCAEVVRTARAFRLTAPWGWERMPALLDRLETELRGGAES